MWIVLVSVLQETTATVTTVAVNGYFKQFRVTSDNGNVEFTNVRFAVSNRARFSLSLGNTESPGTTMATFSGVDAVKSDGGAFYVENGCVAEFSAPITFDSNSVFGGFSGGAFYAAGVVDFKYDTVFNGNTVMNDGTEVGAESGGGLCVAEDGEVSFETYASFEGNVAQALGKGGAVANYGSLVFQGTSVYSGNIAEENHDNFFGYGGAIFTEKGSITVFKARTVMQNNEGASGGALYNVGTTILKAGAFFGDNKATGEERAKGGHIYTKGYVSTTGDLTFLQGSALRGGAVYVTSKGTFFPNDEARFIGNTAVRVACPMRGVSRRLWSC
eukprot:jgi/Undpi1/4415/HiC_scaffold_17.g07770.m1